MKSQTIHTGNGALAETTPLLGRPDVTSSTNKPEYHVRWAGLSEATEAQRSGDTDVEDGLSSSSNEAPKPEVKMAALVPALAIGVGLPTSLYYNPERQL
jgi:hypothetical protein